MEENKHYKFKKESKEDIEKQLKHEINKINEEIIKAIYEDYNKIKKTIRIQKILCYILVPTYCIGIVIHDLLLIRIILIMGLIFNYFHLKDLLSIENENNQFFNYSLSKFKNDLH